MKRYTSIPIWSRDDFGNHVWAFDKIDGSNIRVEWSRKLSKKSAFTMGFNKWGTRNQLIQKNSPFEEAIVRFEDGFAERLDEIFRTDKYFRSVDKVTVYTEFFGPGSFAGQHEWSERHDLSLIDVFLYKKGFVPPSEFLKLFQDLATPRLVYEGTMGETFITRVITNKFNTEEGVVVKFSDNKRVHMRKIKTHDWIQRVKAKYGAKKALKLL